MVSLYRDELGRLRLKSFLLAGCCLAVASTAHARSASQAMPRTMSVSDEFIVVAQSDTGNAPPEAVQQPVGSDGQPANAGNEPASANDLKAAIDAIKQRLAKQQQGRASTGTSELAAELKNARERIADLTDSLSRLRGERDSILAELKNLSDELAQRDKRIADLQNEMATANEETKNRIAALDSDLRKREAERDALRSEAAEAGKRLENALAEIDDLTATVKQAWADRDSVEQSLKEARDQATSEVATRDTALSDAQSKLAEIEAQLSAKLAEQDQQTAELARLRQALAESSTEADLRAKQVATLTEQLNQRTTDLEARSAELQGAESKLTELVARVQQVERESEGRLRERTQTLTNNLESANSRLEKLEAEMQGLREVATTSVAEVENLGQQLLESLNENEVMVTALSEVRASKQLLDEELQAARKDVSVYAADASALREELSRVQSGAAGEAAQAATARGDDVTAQRLQEAQAEIERLTEELISRESRLTELAAGGQNGESSNARIAALEDQLAATESDRDKLEAQLVSLRDNPPPSVEPAAAPADQAQEVPERIEAPAPEVVVATVEPIAEINSFLNDLHARDTGDGWLMTVPDGIVFAPGSDELAVEASPALSKIASLVEHFDQSDVRIVGHTDSFGDAAVNRDLSLRRANSVRDYLTRNYGIDPARIITEGMGEEVPIASNDTIAGRRANRRVEVYVRR
ncbi:MAG: OmpA family protein [Geminicoccaceae bacterium]|nr:OmpA family protein [Geminicoccaceae bacterium]